MLGAIIGDIVGSVYEWHNIKTKRFPLFSPHCFFTDDSIMTLAIAQGLMNGGTAQDYVEAMKKLGRIYPRVDYGCRFGQWLRSADNLPYTSWGNGSAMRVSSIGWFYEDLELAVSAAEVSAAVTHNHPEGIKGAQATAAAIFLARRQQSKEAIKQYITDTYGYNLDRTLKTIRPQYTFDESCQGTVPEAIIAFLESNDFEDAVRNAISLGGDSDTLAAITGAIAEAAYGIPPQIKDKALTYLDKDLLRILNRWNNYFTKKTD